MATAIAAGQDGMASTKQPAAVRGRSGHVVAASYSTGARGRTLKWLPVEPAAGQGRAAPGPQPAVFAPDAGDEKGETNRSAGPPAAEIVILNWQVPKPAEPPASPPADTNAGAAEPGQQLEQPAEAPQIEAEIEQQRIGEEELEKALVARPERGPAACPTREDLKTIRQVRIDITPPDRRLPEECQLEAEPFQPRAWAPITFTWTASALCHKPVYFEDVHLERYGHSWGPIPQPLMSAAHFFVNVPVLPYAMGLCPPNECVYTLGYYRPGSCAPYLIDPLPLSVRAGLFEAGAWVGGVFALP